MPCYGDGWLALRPIKSGSSGLRTFLRDACGWTELPGPQHAPLSYYRETFPEIRGLRAFATLRPVCDWYGSAYFHELRLTTTHPDDPGAASFRDWLHSATHADRHDPLHPVPFINGQWKHRGTGTTGLWSEFYRLVASLGGSDGVDALIATDRMREGVQGLLGVEYTGRTNRRADLDGAGCPVGYDSLYTTEMVRWVERADGVLMARLGVVPFGPTPWAVWRPRS